MNIILVLSVLVAVVLADAGAYQASYYPSEPATIDTHADLRVINGHNATRGQIPYQISIQISTDYCPSFEHLCGGSIIGKHWILTAAHCVSMNETTVDKLQIVAGILLLTDTNVTGQQTIPVAEIIVHELHAVAPNYDIALLRLDEELIYNDNVQPIAIPPSNYHAEGDVVLSGWGLTSARTRDDWPDNLQYVDVPILENDECKKFWDSHHNDYNEFESELNICSGSRDGGEAGCYGDSGGPLVQNGKIVGIAAWGMVICGDMNGPTVYTKVSAFASWIERNTNGQVKPDQINM